MSRFARQRRVFFVEEPVYDGAGPALKVAVCPSTGVHVVTPQLPRGTDRALALERLISELVSVKGIKNPIVWFYTPMGLEFFPSSLSASVVVYDCMDELSMFKDAPPQLRALEDRLFKLADVVFTGGVSLFEAKRHLHRNIHPFPSGVDVPHFFQARSLPDDFQEQHSLPHPRLGYAGVVDERLNLALLEEAATKRPEWQFVMIGPTAKISPGSLPRRSNIHWLGMKSYSDLPKYFAGWDVGIMPFALNDSTRFISPTKTPEYLAAGLPVVSTAIRDVVRPYGELGMARIAESADEFIDAAQQAIDVNMCLKWRERADQFLKSLSWDSVWNGMNRLIIEATATERPLRQADIKRRENTAHV